MWTDLWVLETVCGQRESSEEEVDSDSEPLKTESSPTSTLIQEIYAVCAGFPCVSLPVSPPFLSDSLLPTLSHLLRLLQSLQSQSLSHYHHLQSCQSSLLSLEKLLKSKDEILDSVSEELFLALSEKVQDFIEECDEEGPFEVQEERKELRSVVKREEERREETLLVALNRWKGGISKEIQGKNSLEGAYKSQLLRKNPLLSVLRVPNREKLLSPPVLFNQLFAFMEQCLLQMKGNKGFSPVVFCAKGGLQRQLTSSVSCVLRSLQVYYDDDSMLAGFFSRLLNIFDSDPLLPTPSHELIRLNSDLKPLIQRKSTIQDMESGGFIPLKHALEFSFNLMLFNEEKLANHFLSCIKPQEITDFDWAKFIIFHINRENPRKSGELIDFLPGKFAILHDFLSKNVKNVNLEGVESIEKVVNLLEIGRGELLSYFLQVYDLSVDQLYLLIDETAKNSPFISFNSFQKVCLVLDNEIKPGKIRSIWEYACSVTGNRGDEGRVEKDAAVLGILASDRAEIAAKPLVLVGRSWVRKRSLAIRTEMTEETEESGVECMTTMAAGSGKGRALFTPRGRESVRSSRRSQSIFY